MGIVTFILASAHQTSSPFPPPHIQIQTQRSRVDLYFLCSVFAELVRFLIAGSSLDSSDEKVGRGAGSCCYLFLCTSFNYVLGCLGVVRFLAYC